MVGRRWWRGSSTSPTSAPPPLLRVRATSKKLLDRWAGLADSSVRPPPSGPAGRARLRRLNRNRRSAGATNGSSPGCELLRHQMRRSAGTPGGGEEDELRHTSGSMQRGATDHSACLVRPLRLGFLVGYLGLFLRYTSYLRRLTLGQLHQPRLAVATACRYGRGRGLRASMTWRGVCGVLPGTASVRPPSGWPRSRTDWGTIFLVEAEVRRHRGGDPCLSAEGLNPSWPARRAAERANRCPWRRTRLAETGSWERPGELSPALLRAAQSLERHFEDSSYPCEVRKLGVQFGQPGGGPSRPR